MVMLQPRICSFMKTILGSFFRVASGAIRPPLSVEHPLAGPSSPLSHVSEWPQPFILARDLVRSSDSSLSALYSIDHQVLLIRFLNRTQIFSFLFPSLFSASQITTDNSLLLSLSASVSPSPNHFPQSN